MIPKIAKSAHLKLPAKAVNRDSKFSKEDVLISVRLDSDFLRMIVSNVMQNIVINVKLISIIVKYAKVGEIITMP